MLFHRSFPPLLLFLAGAAMFLGTAPLRGQIFFPTSLLGYNYVGSATLHNKSLILTPTGINQTGAVWFQQKQAVANGFVTQFQFRMSMLGGSGDVNGLNGADGIAFVIQNSSDMALGLQGDGKGYAGLPNSLAIEFDTFANPPPADAPLSWHVSVQTRWTKPNSASIRYSLAVVPAPIMDDEKIHTATIEYQPGTLKVFLDNCSAPLLQIALNIADSLPMLNSSAWVGFTAATASSFQQHEILRWRFNSAGIAVLDSGTCGQDSVVLAAPAGYTSYQWSTGATTQRIVCRTSGLYSVVCKGFVQPEYGAISCGPIGNTFSTVVRLLPPVADIQLTTDTLLPLCSGDRITLQASSADATMVFQWRGLVRPSQTMTVREPGTYYVTGTNVHGCVTTDSIVIDTLKVDLSVRGATALCNGDSVTLEADTGFTSYRWSNGSPTRSIRVGQPGIYSVTAIHANGCTVTSKELAIENRVPTPTIAPSRTSPICTGDSLTLDAGAGYASYRWSTGQQTQKIQVGDDGEYVVEVRTADGCYGRDTIRVKTIPQPFVDAGLDTAICAGDSVQLHGRGEGLILWGSSSSLSCSDCPSPVATPQQTTTYFLQVIGSNRCTARDSVTVTVLPPPVAVVSSDTAICADGAAQLSASLSTSGGAAFRWRPSAGLSCDDCPNPIATPSATTTYSVVVRTTASCADTASLTVTVVPSPSINAGNDTAICMGNSVMLHATGPGPFRWHPNDGLSCTDCPNPIAAPTTTTTYVATTANQLGCTTSDSITVAVAPIPTVDAGEDQEICSGDSLQLEAAGVGVFHWEPSTGLRCTGCPNPTATPTETTTYRVTVTTPNGCIATDTVTLRVNPAPRTLQTFIKENIRGKLGGSVRVPVLVRQDVAAIKATTVRIHIRFDTTIMRPNQLTATELQAATKGGELEGWNVRVEAAGADSLTLIAESGHGATFAGNGEVIAPGFTLFLGTTTQARVAATVTLPNAPCTQSLPGVGFVMIDSLCGLSLRLMELSASSFSLQQNHPNPFNPVTSLPFSLGLDGHVTAEIFDAAGNLVTRLMDAPISHGRYTIDWDASGYPSGIYYFRIRSGDWQHSIPMVLAK